MKRHLALVTLLALGGCAAPAASVAGRTTLASRAEVGAEVGQQARGEREEQARDRLRQLEAQLGLARAEAESLREEVEALRATEATRTTRIRQCAQPEEVALVVADEPEPRAAARPVLRLYGAAEDALRPAASLAGVRTIPGPPAPAMLAAPPAGSVRLLVGPGAELDPEAGVPAIPSTPVAVASSEAPVGAVARAPVVEGPRIDDAAAAQYREALRHLSDRRLGEALTALARFVSEHPEHPYADNALYWRGEIEYTQRDYPRALRSFGDLLRRYPRGNKVPDALLRIGLCYRQMGDLARARRVLDRLRMQYPDSVAARMASQEDA